MEPAPHIALVDDHRDIRDLVGRYLSQHGYRVSVAENGAALRRLLERSAPDLVVLDIMMPGEDGLSVCRHLRSTTNLPIIFLTAMAEETERIIGLEIGADDYLTKPFNPRELLARIKAVLRRVNSLPPQRDKLKAKAIRFDRWHLNVGRRELVNSEGVGVPLSTAEFRLLKAFLDHAGMVLTRDQLLDLTAGRAAEAFDRSIDNQVSRLRKKIELDPKTPILIKTHWGGGYSFTAEVEDGMRRLWARSLAAQIIVAMLLALGLSQVIGFMISWDERGRALYMAAKNEFLVRTASLAQLLETTPSTLENDILNASNTTYTRFWVSRDEPVDSTAWRHEAWTVLAQPLPTLSQSVNGRRRPERQSPQASYPSGSIVAAAAAMAHLTWADASGTRMAAVAAGEVPLSRRIQGHGDRRPARIGRLAQRGLFQDDSELHMDVADGGLARHNGRDPVADRDLRRPQHRQADAPSRRCGGGSRPRRIGQAVA